MRALLGILCVGLGCGGGERSPPNTPLSPAQLTNPDGTKFVPPSAVEGERVAGEKYIVPDDVDRIVMADEAPGRETRAAGSFRLCLDNAGQVVSVTMLRSTGIPNYDRKIIRTILTTWRYRPFMIEGHPYAICTIVSYIYNQRPGGLMH
jgi:hypothetical protein